MGSQPQPPGSFAGPTGVGLGISPLPPNTPLSQQQPMPGGPPYNQRGQIMGGNPSLVSLGDPMPDHLASAMQAAQEMAHQANSPSYLPPHQLQNHHTGGPIGHPGGPHPPTHQGSIPPPSHQGPPMHQHQHQHPPQHVGPPNGTMSVRQQSIPAPQTPHSQHSESVPPPTVRMPLHGLPPMGGPVGYPGPPLTAVKAESLPHPGFGGGCQDGPSGNGGGPIGAGPSGIRTVSGQFR